MTDQKDYRQYLEEKFDSLHDKLDAIKEQTTLTNSRVSHAENDIVNLKIDDERHFKECPAMPKIDCIEKDLLELNFFKKHPKAALLIIGSIVIMAGTWIYDIVDKSGIAHVLKGTNKEIRTDNKILIDNSRNLQISIDSLRDQINKHIVK